MKELILGFIAEHPGCTAGQLGLAFDSMVKFRYSNRGRNLWWGRYVGKLKKQGLVRTNYVGSRTEYYLR